MMASDGYTGKGDKPMTMKRPKHSGFEAPCIGEVVPEGTKWKKNPDGTISPIFPDAQKQQKEKLRDEDGTEST